MAYQCARQRVLHLALLGMGLASTCMAALGVCDDSSQCFEVCDDSHQCLEEASNSESMLQRSLGPRKKAKWRKEHEYAKAGDLDCADEVILRTLFAESFEVPSLSECLGSVDAQVEELSQKFKAGTWKGWGHHKEGEAPAWPGDETVAKKIRTKCYTKQGHGIALGPRLVRMTFHDAADAKNLAFANGTDASKYGGVDSCLHSALLSVGNSQAGGGVLETTEKRSDTSNSDEDPDDVEDEEVAEGDPNHNRGLRNAELWVGKMSRLVGLSEPDAQVLGSLVAIEAWHAGPEVDFAFGRVRGHCNKLICTNEKCWDKDTPFFKQAVAEPVGVGMMCPMTNTISALEKLIGLNTSMLVALQGAHSIGGVIVCSGLGNVASGPFCPANCGLPKFDAGNLDGTTFDDTPGKLDNRYYQLLVPERYEKLPDCKLAKFPILNKNKYIARGEDTCQYGIAYPPESQCDVESCVEQCDLTPECMEAQQAEDADHKAYKAAWKKCIECQVKCSPQHSLKHAMSVVKTHVKGKSACVMGCVQKVRTCVQSCKKTRKEAIKKCKGRRGRQRRECMQTMKTAWKKCREGCGKASWSKCKVQCVEEHELGGNLTWNGRTKNVMYKGKHIPARWCKRMTAIKACLDADVKLPINGGWGDCPEKKRMTFPNLGQGRHTVIQNLERFSTFRGLKKRLMVLPSDWSYLKSKPHRYWFEKYALDNKLFLKNFAHAWKVVSEKGWEGKLQKCTPVKCTVTDGDVTCPVAHRPMGEMSEDKDISKRQFMGTGPKSGRPKKLTFSAKQCDKSIPKGESCQIIGAKGVRAKLLCGKVIVMCCYAAACAMERRIKKEWAEGGQVPTCQKEKGGVPTAFAQMQEQMKLKHEKQSEQPEAAE